VVDSRTLKQIASIPGKSIPGMPDLSDAGINAKDIPAQIMQFNKDLIASGIHTARTFTARVKMVNGLP
jgi:hypothetical protein